MAEHPLLWGWDAESAEGVALWGWEPAGEATPVTVTPEPRLTALTAIQTLLCSSTIEIGYGVELLDTTDAIVADISTECAGGEVEFHADAVICGTAIIYLADELDWANVRIRPYQTVTLGDITERYNLGVYCPVEPEAGLGVNPVLYQVAAYDKTSYLDRPIGDTYQVDASTNVFTAAQALVTASGMTGASCLFDTSVAVTTSEALVWVLDSDETTYLKAINDLLAWAAMEPLWADNEGVFRSRPIAGAATKPSQWTFDLSDERTQLVCPSRQHMRSEYDRTNWWRFIQEGVDVPTEGTGFYTVDNSAAGVKYKRTVFLPVDSQTELVTQGDDIVERGGIRKETISISTAPMPLFATWGRFPVVTYIDYDAGGSRRCQVASHRIPLSGDDCSITLEVT